MGKAKLRRRKQWYATQERARAKAVARAHDGLNELQNDSAILYGIAMEAVRLADYKRANGLQEAAARISAETRQRVRTILNIQPEGIWSHSETCPIILGIQVDVGGCVGHISEIHPDTVIIRGTYFYSDGGSGGYAENWAMEYMRADLVRAKFSQWAHCNRPDGTHRIWDASEIKVYG